MADAVVKRLTTRKIVEVRDEASVRAAIRHVVIDPAKLEPRDFVDGRWPD